MVNRHHTFDIFLHQPVSGLWEGRELERHKHYKHDSLLVSGHLVNDRWSGRQCKGKYLHFFSTIGTTISVFHGEKTGNTRFMLSNYWVYSSRKHRHHFEGRRMNSNFSVYFSKCIILFSLHSSHNQVNFFHIIHPCLSVMIFREFFI